jgi:hypothetical protein
MTTKGFIFLLIVSIVTVMIAGTLAERWAAPGLERTAWVAVLSALVIFPAAKWAETRGWIKGKLQLGKMKSEFTSNKNSSRKD